MLEDKIKALENIRKLMKKYGKGRSIVDELIAEGRAEAKKEFYVKRDTKDNR